MDHEIVLKHSYNYYPKGNILAKSMNKNMVHIIKEAIEDHPRSYHKALSNALWED
jgi:hypothetical protein